MRNMQSISPKNHLQRGVSLIEVLVALMVLAVGLLGMAALLGNAMQFNQGAQARTQAVLLANDMAERVRANRPNRADYNMLPADADVVLALEDTNVVCDITWQPDPDLTVAQNDINEWTSGIGCNVPGGVGVIQVIGNVLNIAIGWIDTTGTTAGDQEVFLLSLTL